MIGKRPRCLTPRQRALTRRQIEIGVLVADALQDKEIAARLGISEETVNFHLRGAFARRGFVSRTQLALYVRLVLRLGAVEPAEVTTKNAKVTKKSYLNG